MIEMARKAAAHGEQTVLFIDEVHRFSKTQQDALLSAVENRVVLLVAATTENPSFSVVAPLLSRSLILQLRPLTADDVRTVVQRAIDDPRGLAGRVPVDPTPSSYWCGWPPATRGAR
ncbi:ATPase associated with various cellular activities family protein [Mycobacterium xenopi 4042]|uniref:ATPase associated with various cellular activities family protein n=1 Tax=Mycobacterium xenopi 4042 TaxID=1299334 RepID=X8BMU1_MYCXE|nr:ATPase associated with various cellular activities family protein [Mycobacterium xenopi 4042]